MMVWQMKITECSSRGGSEDCSPETDRPLRDGRVGFGRRGKRRHSLNLARLHHTHLQL